MICDNSVYMVHQTEGELKATITFEVAECYFFFISFTYRENMQRKVAILFLFKVWLHLVFHGININL